MTRFFVFFFFFFSFSFSQIQKVDVSFYDLDLDFDIENKSIKGSNTIFFNVLESIDTLQLNLFQNFFIDSILFLDSKCDFKHIDNNIHIFLKDALHVGAYDIEVFYQGKPQIAKNAPWDGGFVWDKDSFGNDWVGVACQGIGSSVWWPGHDVLYDEADSIRFSATVPENLKVVSNGDLSFSKDTIVNGFHKKLFVWKNSYPINNYNLSVNIADYQHFSDTLLGVNGGLNLDYYVLKENFDVAVKHFSQVKPMLHFFEKKFGPYPFYSDGYALVETPYLGMEHQTCIAYGNQFKKGYLGKFPSDIDFDFIIIHETAHEWWGNNISMGHMNDMWIHEAFATYAEALYVEEMYGYDEMLVYLNYQKKKIKNKHPIKSDFFSSTDMYYKGSWMLHTLRTVLGNDYRWDDIIKGLQFEFKDKIVNTNDIIQYFMNSFFGVYKSKRKEGDYLSQNYQDSISYLYNRSNKPENLKAFFQQYLFESDLPILEYFYSYEGEGTFLNFRWNAVSDFDMPIIINNGKEKKQRKNLTPNRKKTYLARKDAFIKGRDNPNINKKLPLALWDDVISFFDFYINTIGEVPDSSFYIQHYTWIYPTNVWGKIPLIEPIVDDNQHHFDRTEDFFLIDIKKIK